MTQSEVEHRRISQTRNIPQFNLRQQRAPEERLNRTWCHNKSVFKLKSRFMHLHIFNKRINEVKDYEKKRKLYLEIRF